MGEKGGRGRMGKPCSVYFLGITHSTEDDNIPFHTHPEIKESIKNGSSSVYK